MYGHGHGPAARCWAYLGYIQYKRTVNGTAMRSRKDKFSMQMFFNANFQARSRKSENDSHPGTKKPRAVPQGTIYPEQRLPYGQW